MTASSISIGESFTTYGLQGTLASVYASGQALPLPYAASAYDPFNLSNVTVSVSGSEMCGMYWFRIVQVAKGGSVAVNADITALPAMAGGQSGQTISFTPAGGTVTAQTLNITGSSCGLGDAWTFVLPSGVNSVTLPAIPPGPTPVLGQGSTYYVRVGALSAPAYTYNSLLTALSGSGQITSPAEQGMVAAVSWTR